VAEHKATTWDKKMTEEIYLKFGPQPPYSTKGRGYIALNNSATRREISSDFLLGKECSSLQEIESEVAVIRRDLDEIVRLARERFKS
jgi:hypothetical protein